MGYVGDGLARNLLKIYAGDGVARDVAKGYIGDENNIARLAYSKAPAGMPIFNLPVGALVKAPLDGVPTLTRILHHGSPGSLYYDFEDTTTFMFENIIENRPWHSSEVNNYAGSAIHTYQNGDFLARLGFANQLKQVRVPYRPGSGVANTVNSGANGLLTSVWLLSGYEVKAPRILIPSTYFAVEGVTLSYFTDFAEKDARRKGYLNGVATNYWLRSPALVADLLFVGSIFAAEGQGGASNSISATTGFRPAFALPNTALVDPTPNPDGSYNLLVA